MALPFVIEYLLAQERPGGGKLVTVGTAQIYVPVFPPGYTLILTLPPPTAIYAQIWSWIRVGAAVVPDAFEGWYQQAGSRLFTVILNDVIGDQYDTYTFITHAEPLIIHWTNVSPLNQFWESNGGFIEIQTKEDLDLVREHIARIGTSTKLERLQAETNRILSLIAGVK